MTDHHEDQADSPGRVVEQHTYRIEVKVPRVARPSETRWRTLVPPLPYGQAMDVGGHLREALVASGLFDEDLVDEFFATSVRCIEYTIETRRTRELPLTDRS